MPKLTKRTIDALRPKASGDLFAWDDDIKGFGVRIKPSGSGSYLIQYRTPQGRTRRLAFATLITPAEEAPMAHDIGLDRRYLDFVVFPDQFHLGVGRHRPAA
jgi:hypothetical protein